MKATTALNHQNRFKEVMSSIYSAAESYGESHEWILNELQTRIYGTPEWKRVPRSVRDYIWGFQDCYMKMAYYPAKLLTWVHIWDGQAYPDWDSAPEACKQAMRENRGDSAHVWTKHLPKIKRFSSAKPIA